MLLSAQVAVISTLDFTTPYRISTLRKAIISLKVFADVGQMLRSVRTRSDVPRRRERLVFACLAGLVATLVPVDLAAQANGRLQIHFMNVWQGDGSLLISPGGETVLFDNGVNNRCDRPIAYLQQLGVTGIDYHVASHYHADHIGCTREVLDAFPLRVAAFDRGSNYHTPTYDRYVTAVGALRQTATIGSDLVLDAASGTPVTIRFVAANATTTNGQIVATDNENDLSLVALISYGGFRAEMGGDLSGEHTTSYEDVETDIALHVGRIDVYKVHHHCSRHSTNTNWLNTTLPRIGIISAGNNNTFGHPTQDCLDRLHDASVVTYWTEEGNGGDPVPGRDVVAGNIIVEADPAAGSYSVTRTRDNVTDRYPFWTAQGPTPPTGGGPPGGYAWSRLSRYFHYANCSYVGSISTPNLVRGAAAPADKALHSGCPR